MQDPPLRWLLGLLAVAALAICVLGKCASDDCEARGGHLVGTRNYICVSDDGRIIP